MSTQYKDPEVATLAKELMAHTLQVTANTNNFPKKYKFTIVDKLVDLSSGIYENIIDANSSNELKIRVRYQTSAISKCRKMRGYLEVILRVLHPSCSISHWCKMIMQIETQLLNWKKYTESKLT